MLGTGTERETGTGTGSAAATATGTAGNTVEGAVQVRGPASATLPRTGIEAGTLLMLGGALVLAGILMVRYAPQDA